jgi:hypothetical protein
MAITHILDQTIKKQKIYFLDLLKKVPTRFGFHSMSEKMIAIQAVFIAYSTLLTTIIFFFTTSLFF